MHSGKDPQDKPVGRSWIDIAQPPATIAEVIDGLTEMVSRQRKDVAAMLDTNESEVTYGELEGMRAALEFVKTGRRPMYWT